MLTKKKSGIKAGIDLILTSCVTVSYLQESWMFCFELYFYPKPHSNYEAFGFCHFPVR